MADEGTIHFARSVFERESERLACEACVAAHDPGLVLDFSRARGVLLDILEIVYHARGAPVENLGSLIRRRLADQNFHDEAGDAVIDSRYQVALEQEVDLVLIVLEEVRGRGERPERRRTAPRGSGELDSETIEAASASCTYVRHNHRDPAPPVCSGRGAPGAQPCLLKHSRNSLIFTASST